MSLEPYRLSQLRQEAKNLLRKMTVDELVDYVEKLQIRIVELESTLNDLIDERDAHLRGR